MCAGSVELHMHLVETHQASLKIQLLFEHLVR